MQVEQDWKHRSLLCMAVKIQQSLVHLLLEKRSSRQLLGAPAELALQAVLWIACAFSSPCVSISYVTAAAYIPLPHALSLLARTHEHPVNTLS